MRRYDDRPVSREQVAALIDAAEAAPSAGNLRARRYVIITEPEMRAVLAMTAYGQTQVSSAPVLVVVFADVPRSSLRYGDRGSLYAIQDADAGAMCLLLAAYDTGLGACWNGAFDDALVREALGLSSGILPVAMISLGWPAESPAAASRRHAEDIVTWIE